MSAHLGSYRSLEDSSGISALLDMIARRGPELMRQGGGSLTRSPGKALRRTTEEDRDEILRIRKAGATISETAARTGWSYKTVWSVLPDDGIDGRRIPKRVAP